MICIPKSLAKSIIYQFPGEQPIRRDFTGRLLTTRNNIVTIPGGGIVRLMQVWIYGTSNWQPGVPYLSSVQARWESVPFSLSTSRSAAGWVAAAYLTGLSQFFATGMGFNRFSDPCVDTQSYPWQVMATNETYVINLWIGAVIPSGQERQCTPNQSRCDLIVTVDGIETVITGRPGVGCAVVTLVPNQACPDGYTECNDGCIDCGGLVAAIRGL